MAQIYKIYINETVLILTDSLPPDPGVYEELKAGDFKFRKFYEKVKFIQDGEIFILLTKDFKKIFKKIKRSMALVKAGGGVVSNEKNRYLFIFRKDKWDLPKGKLDGDETFRNAAVREVEEECGIKIDRSGSRICTTYHIYEINNSPVMKKTAWFRMRADHQEQLVPQLEEDITDARWLAPADLTLVTQNTYPLIRDIIKTVVTEYPTEA